MDIGKHMNEIIYIKDLELSNGGLKLSTVR